MRVRKQKFHSILFLLVLTSGMSVFAQDAGVKGQPTSAVVDVDATKIMDEAAKTAFLEATKRYNEGRYEEAAGKFNEAYRLKPSWKLYYNIGQAEASAKRQGLAIEAFEKYLTEGGDEIPMSRRDDVLREIERLRQIVGAVDLDAPDGFLVFIDGIERGMTPLAGRLRVSASQAHVIELRHAGVVVASQKIVVAGQETVSVKFNHGLSLSDNDAAPVLASIASSADVTDAQSIRKMRRQARILKIAGWTSLGVGGGMAVLGLLGAVEARQQKVANDKISCLPGDTDCADDLNRKESDQQSLRGLSVAALAMGAVAMIASPILLNVSKKKNARANALESVFLPLVSRQFSGVFIQTTF